MLELRTRVVGDHGVAQEIADLFEDKPPAHSDPCAFGKPTRLEIRQKREQMLQTRRTFEDRYISQDADRLLPNHGGGGGDRGMATRHGSWLYIVSKDMMLSRTVVERRVFVSGKGQKRRLGFLTATHALEVFV